MNLGAKAIKSLAAESEFADMFTPRLANAKERAAKNLHGRLLQLLISTVGSQGISPPYLAWPAEEAVRPMKAIKVNTIGSIGT